MNIRLACDVIHGFDGSLYIEQIKMHLNRYDYVAKIIHVSIRKLFEQK